MPIDLMGNAVIANLETAVVLVDGLDLLDFGCRRGCEIAFDFGVERRLVVLDGEQVVGPGVEAMVVWQPMASVETRAPSRSSRSMRAGMAVISLDFSNTAS
jgi:hypothetical protein